MPANDEPDPRPGVKSQATRARAVAPARCRYEDGGECGAEAAACGRRARGLSCSVPQSRHDLAAEPIRVDWLQQPRGEGRSGHAWFLPLVVATDHEDRNRP